MIQLAKRIAVSTLDWSTVDADPGLARIWARRDDLLDALAPVPRVLSHGDFHVDQLSAAGDSTIVLDWSTLGVGPAGSDLAHLVLSTVDGHEALYQAYLDGLGATVPADLVRTGCRITLALTGTSRVHWMLANEALFGLALSPEPTLVDEPSPAGTVDTSGDFKQRSEQVFLAMAIVF